MQSNERENAGVFVIFMKPEAREANYFVEDRVRERRHKFSCDNFNPSVVNLRIVYAIAVLFVVALCQTTAFTFPKKSDKNCTFFCKDV